MENREIKFRGYSERNRERIYGWFVKGSNGEFYIISSKDFSTYNVVPESVSQYTGLKDKNGKEIYESDLVTITDPYNNLTAKGVAIIIFSHAYVGGWVATVNYVNYLNIGTRTGYIEVVGNLFENKNLLN